MHRRSHLHDTRYAGRCSRQLPGEGIAAGAMPPPAAHEGRKRQQEAVAASSATPSLATWRPTGRW